jgi:hypothetical protein
MGQQRSMGQRWDGSEWMHGTECAANPAAAVGAHAGVGRGGGDWKWPSRCCCRSDAAGPMPAADPRRTMHRRQLLALQHACLHGFGGERPRYYAPAIGCIRFEKMRGLLFIKNQQNLAKPEICKAKKRLCALGKGVRGTSGSKRSRTST